jgi:hypothetical protein
MTKRQLKQLIKEVADSVIGTGTKDSPIKLKSMDNKSNNKFDMSKRLNKLNPKTSKISHHDEANYRRSTIELQQLKKYLVDVVMRKYRAAMTGWMKSQSVVFSRLPNDKKNRNKKDPIFRSKFFKDYDEGLESAFDPITQQFLDLAHHFEKSFLEEIRTLSEASENDEVHAKIIEKFGKKWNEYKQAVGEFLQSLEIAIQNSYKKNDQKSLTSIREYIKSFKNYLSDYVKAYNSMDASQGGPETFKDTTLNLNTESITKSQLKKLIKEIINQIK